MHDPVVPAWKASYKVSVGKRKVAPAAGMDADADGISDESTMRTDGWRPWGYPK